MDDEGRKGVSNERAAWTVIIGLAVGAVVLWQLWQPSVRLVLRVTGE